MFHVEKQSGDKEKDYQLLLKQLEAMTEDETDQIANYANASALLYHSLPEVNWAGFYFAKEEDGQLVLGPFKIAGMCSDSFRQRGLWHSVRKRKSGTC